MTGKAVHSLDSVHEILRKLGMPVRVPDEFVRAIAARSIRRNIRHYTSEKSPFSINEQVEIAEGLVCWSHRAHKVSLPPKTRQAIPQRLGHRRGRPLLSPQDLVFRELADLFGASIEAGQIAGLDGSFQPVAPRDLRQRKQFKQPDCQSKEYKTCLVVADERVRVAKSAPSVSGRRLSHRRLPSRA